MLARGRRLPHLALWCTVGTLAAAGFLAGFELNTAQRFSDFTWSGLGMMGAYWLALLGSVPALGHMSLAPWLGATLLVLLAWAAAHKGAQREAVAFPLACFAIGALALIAIGRAADSGGVVHSRYYVLAGLAWALVLFMVVERTTLPKRPYRVLWGCVPALVAFNVAADRVFAHRADSWVECRDRAAVRFKEFGVDGRGQFSLYPVPARSTQLLEAAEQRGIYRMAPICDERSFPEARPSDRIVYFVEDIKVSQRSATVAGWAAIPGLPSKRGQIHVVLQSGDKTHVFTSVAITRPDVATALKHPENTLAGFRFSKLRDRLPVGEFQVGFMIKDGGMTEYIMTGHRLRLVGDGEALLASSN
jgi:hypothetical protein